MSLKQVASEVLSVLERGSYTVGEAVIDLSQQHDRCMKATHLYSPEQLAELRVASRERTLPRIEVVDGTTQAVARQMAAAGGPLALLNFASARNPGGGFLNGAKAQEEDLCRCSGLYPCLLQCREYYEMNRRCDSLLYTDYAIYSPDVPFFKVSGTGDYLAEPFYASIVTAPAPNSGPFLRSHADDLDMLEATFLRRWQNVFCIARDQRMRRLLLGAWGCGAFGGDPAMAARTAQRALNQFGAAFDEVVFAIPDAGKQGKRNHQAFRAVFSS